MFNHQAFNQGAFNVSFDAPISLQTDAYETIKGIFGGAVTVHLDTVANESVTCSGYLSAGVMQHAAMEESVDARAAANGAISMTTGAYEHVKKSGLHLGARLSLRTATDGLVQAAAHLGCVCTLATGSYMDVQGEAVLGSMASMPGQNLYEIISSAVDMEAQDIINVIIDVTLEPGQTLVIDSNDYVVLLNGENIVARHAGGWPFFDRRTRSMQIETGNPVSLEASILYTERWL